MKGLIAAAVLTCFVCSTASAESDKVRRLKIAGWTTTAVGASLFIAGFSYGAANRCSESQPGCNDEDMFRQIDGWIIMSVGGTVAIGVGMPMLIRARRLERRSRELTITPGLSGLTLSGHF